MMLLSHITFDDGLDLSPPTNEEFRYEIGEEFVYHWILSPINPPVLFAAYNTRYIRELIFVSTSSSSQQHTDNSTRQSNIPNNLDIGQNPIDTGQTGNSMVNQEESEEDEYDDFQLQSETSDDILHEGVLPTFPQDTEIKTPLPRLIDICTCDPVPDPNCPICNHEHLHAHKD